MAEYGQALLQSLANFRQEELARQQLEKQNQLNIPAMLAGALTSGRLQGMFQGAGIKRNIPETLQSVDWGKLGTNEALTSALTGAISPNYGGLKDVAAGGVGALQTAAQYKKLAQEAKEAEMKKAVDLTTIAKNVGLKYIPTGELNLNLPEIGKVPLGLDDEMTKYQKESLRLKELLLKKSGEGALTPAQTLNAHMQLRKEYLASPIVKDYNEIRGQVSKMEEAYKSLGTMQGRNAIDQSIIMIFNKLNDPSSVVRESEYARTPEGLSAMNRINAAAQKISAGGAGLTNQDRKELVDMGKKFADSAKKLFTSYTNDYSELASSQGLDVNKVIPASLRKISKESVMQDQGQIAPDGSRYELNGKTFIKINGQWVQE